MNKDALFIRVEKKGKIGSVQWRKIHSAYVFLLSTDIEKRNSSLSLNLKKMERISIFEKEEYKAI